MKPTTFVVLLTILRGLVYGQFCQLYADEPWPSITDVSKPTPLTLAYTYTVEECTRATTETRTLTAYLPGGSPYYASPVVLRSTGTFAVSTAKFVFPSLIVTNLYPGEELELEYFPTNSFYVTQMSILTVAEAIPTTSPLFSFTSIIATTSAAPTSAPSPSSSASSLQSQSKSNTPSIIAGVIGTIVAVIVIGLLAWVILMSRCFRSRGAQLEPESSIAADKSAVNSSPQMRQSYSTTAPLNGPRL